MITLFLKMHGYNAQHVATGMAALQLVTTTLAPGVVLLDLDLPDLGGSEVYRALRQQSGWQDVPVVLATGSSVGKATASNLGIPHYLAKPFHPQALLRLVQEVCQVPRIGT